MRSVRELLGVAGAAAALCLAWSCASTAPVEQCAQRDTFRAAAGAAEPRAELGNDGEPDAVSVKQGAAVAERDGERVALRKLSPEEVEQLTAEDDEGEPRSGPMAATALLVEDTFVPRAGDLTPEAEEREGREASRPAAVSRAGPKYTIVLKNTFIEKYKNKATISAPFQVVHAGSVHDQSDDGDQHVAGLCDEVGFATVAEIMNARDHDAAVDAMEDAEASGDEIRVYGAWRLWCEHPSVDPMVQDDPIPAFPHSNPDHVFEIHPAYRINNIKFLESLKPIPGYTPKEAKKAFEYYESLRCRVEPSSMTTTIVTDKAGYNYVKFELKVEEDTQFITTDGRMVRCSARTLSGTEIVGNRRMVFIKGTAPEVAVRPMKTGDTMVVLGMPRIDLAVIAWRAKNAGTRPEALTWDLPYEIVVVGKY
jgi:hypothetical protein